MILSKGWKCGWSAGINDFCFGGIYCLSFFNIDRRGCVGTSVFHLFYRNAVAAGSGMLAGGGAP